MRLNTSPAWIRCLILLIGSFVSALLFMGSSKQRVDPRGWRLGDFIDHLQTHGIKLRVIAARQDGLLEDNAYLTENPDETWLSFQGKVKSVDRIDQWRGSVWVVWNNPHDEGIRHLAEPSWGRYGWQIGDFLIFGDDRIIQRIQRVFQERPRLQPIPWAATGVLAS